MNLSTPNMSISPLAGKQAPKELLIDIAHLEVRYYQCIPSLEDKEQLVKFGTSGHRGSPLQGTFTEAHILAITQAICDYRKQEGIDGPLYLGKDTHALSQPAEQTALEVLSANGVEVILQRDNGFTPTPVISRAILTYNRNRKTRMADGIIVTPSHNPPEDGGFKYNPTHGGPANSKTTTCIEKMANALLLNLNRGVKRLPYATALKSVNTHHEDLMTPYVDDLCHVVDMESIRLANISLGGDPMGGASVHYWEAIARTYHLNLQVINTKIDPTFAFMPIDHDGKIRMDCSSPYAMAILIGQKDNFRLSFGNDPDSDRHGIVTPKFGLINPNHFLAVAIDYLLSHRKNWPNSAAVGKTLVSSSMIDRVVRGANRKLSEVPVGFKWFAQGLLDGSYCFGGEESAGASFLRSDGTVWTTDKDGFIMALLAAEITVSKGKDPGEYFDDLTANYGVPYYTRIDSPATTVDKERLSHLSADAIHEHELAGEPILKILSKAPGNDALIGGLKVITANGWFAARPSGTEDIYKIYAESFRSLEHLTAIVENAQQIVTRAITN